MHVCLRRVFRFELVGDEIRHTELDHQVGSPLWYAHKQCQIAGNPAIVCYSYVADCSSQTLPNPSPRQDHNRTLH